MTTLVTLTQIARDAYARTTLYRESGNPHKPCINCGTQKKTMFRYTWVSDDDKIADLIGKPWFCSIGCWRSYNG